MMKMKKPLIWELVRDTERFQFMSGERVEHVVIKMTSLDKIQDDIWWVCFANTHWHYPTALSVTIFFQEL